MATGDGTVTRRRFGKWAAAGLGTAAVAGVAGYATFEALGHRDKRLQLKNASAPGVTGANSLAAHAAARGLLYGAAVDPELLDVEGIAAGHTDDAYTQLFAEQTRILVAENAMKWFALRPAADRFDFANADRMIRFARLTGKVVRGHNLCWHEGLPWWFAKTVNKNNARQFLTEHIRTVAGHFRGQVQSWDVVNEAIWLQDGRPDGLRKWPWLELIGPEYIELAFRTATEADPQVKLTYNDYGIESDKPDEAAKRAQVLALLKRLKASGVPIGAMGVQSHLHATGAQPGARLREFLSEVAAMGLEVYITEMDVISAGIAGGQAGRDRATAKVYGDYASLMLADPNVKMLLTWGLSSDHTWVNTPDQRMQRFPDIWSERPLPFDDDDAPTDVFWALRGAFDGANRE
jgi:endo-1,4-beta-xylanase